MWDEPAFTTYFFRLPKEAASSPEALAAATEGLIRWNGSKGAPTPELRFESIKLSVYRSPARQAWLGYGRPVTPSIIPRQFDEPGRFYAIWVHGDATTAWLSVSLGKFYLLRYPAEMMWIRERFPPLRLRLAKLPKAKVIEQARATGCLFQPQRSRCLVLVSEALRRAPDADEFRSLISAPSMNEVLAAAHAAGVLPRYRAALLARMIELAPGTRMDPGGDMFESADRKFWRAMQDATEVDLTREALGAFLQGQVASFGVEYLAERIHTLADAYDFVQILTERHEVTGQWSGIAIIAKRMRLSDGGVPLAPPPLAVARPLSAKLQIELLDVNLKQALEVSSEPGTIIVEGHATPDEGDLKSTQLLGARRAEAVKTALVRAGIPPDRIRAVSYASEKPYCEDHDPQRDCAGWNRRAHFTY